MSTKCRKNDNLQTIVWENFQMLYYLTSISNERWDFQLCKFTTLTPDNLGQEVNALFDKGHLTLKYSWILVIFKEVVDLFAVEVRGQFGGLCLVYYLFLYCSSNVSFWKLLIYGVWIVIFCRFLQSFSVQGILDGVKTCENEHKMQKKWQVADNNLRDFPNVILLE